MAVSYVRLLRADDARDPQAASITVQTEEGDAVHAIVRGVAVERGLELWGTSATACARAWDFNGDGHARSISMSVEGCEPGPASFEIEVCEWLSFGHSDFGDALLDDLRARLCDRFGEHRVDG